VAQTVVTMVLEPLVEPHFHPDSYAYRPGRSALDAVDMALLGIDAQQVIGMRLMRSKRPASATLRGGALEGRV
jgi:hypothetical protein